MNTATPFPWPELAVAEKHRTAFRAIFEHAPIAVARCSPQGVIVEMNPAFEQALARTPDGGVPGGRSLRLCELVRPEDRDQAELLLRDLLDSQVDSFGLEARDADHGQAIAKWTAWRQTGCGSEPDHALLIAEPMIVAHTIAEHSSAPVLAEEKLLQTQRWEAVGRLTGGVVHDFNNLLTGVMLYCDLLLSSLDGRDRRRRYAEEIRSAIVQGTGLMKQLQIGRASCRERV